MSAPAFAWAMEQGASLRLSPAERLVLLYLADMANGERVCWPGQETIVRFTGLALRTVRTVIQGLVRHGLIQVDSHPGLVTRYHILRPDTPASGHGGNGRHPGKPAHSHPGNISPTAPANSDGVTPANQHIPPGNPSQGDPGKSCAEPRQMAQPTPANRLPDPLSVPKKETLKNSPPIVPPSRGDRAFYPADFETFWEAYPRKAGKRAALKVWGGAVKRAGGGAAIMAGLASHRFATEERFIPHPATWLTRDQWLDQQDSFDPVLRAVGLTPDDFADWPVPDGRLLQ